MAMNAINDDTKESTQSFLNLPEIVESWINGEHGREWQEVFHNIYEVTKDSQQKSVPPDFEDHLSGINPGIRAMFDSVRYQQSMCIHSKWTNEDALYSSLPEKIPGSRDVESMDSQLIEQMNEETNENCDFCDPSRFTAKDWFGMMENNNAVAVANAFKFEPWHALIIMKCTHHNTNWNMLEFLDCFELAETWFKRVKDENPECKYPMMLWDALPRSGGTQFHPHFHCTLNRFRYHGCMNSWYQANCKYKLEYPKRSYMKDIIGIHKKLGLAVIHGKAAALAHIAPKKEYEVLIISEHGCTSFYELIYFVYRAFIEDLGQSSISLVIVLPTHGEGDFCAFARIIPRGFLCSQESDITTHELWAATSVSTDPYKVASLIENSILKRQSGKLR